MEDLLYSVKKQESMHARKITCVVGVIIFSVLIIAIVADVVRARERKPQPMGVAVIFNLVCTVVVAVVVAVSGGVLSGACVLACMHMATQSLNQTCCCATVHSLGQPAEEDGQALLGVVGLHLWTLPSWPPPVRSPHHQAPRAQHEARHGPTRVAVFQRLLASAAASTQARSQPADQVV